MSSAVIIGGGAAGIAAALTAARRGLRVKLIEASNRLGGKLGSFNTDTGHILNFGEHLITGEYHDTLQLLRQISAEDCVTLQERLDIPFYHPQKGHCRFTAGKLPPPFNFLSSITSFKYLSFTEKARLGMNLKKLLGEVSIYSCTFPQYFPKINQTEFKYFWEPFIVSALNVHPDEADIKLVQTAIREGFTGEKGMGFFTAPLAEIFNIKAGEALKKAGVDLILRNRVSSVDIAGNKIENISLNDQTMIRADNYIFALPPENLLKVFGENYPALELQMENNDFRYSPICNVHLILKKEIFTERFGCLLDTLPQWFIRAGSWDDRGKGYAYCLVISAADRYIPQGIDIISLCLRDLRRCGAEFSDDDILYTRVIDYKKATLKFTPEFNRIRPCSLTGLKNAFLAGDWIDTGLPATIESAVRSGFRAGEMVS